MRRDVLSGPNDNSRLYKSKNTPKPNYAERQSVAHQSDPKITTRMNRKKKVKVVNTLRTKEQVFPFERKDLCLKQRCSRRWPLVCSPKRHLATKTSSPLSKALMQRILGPSLSKSARINDRGWIFNLQPVDWKHVSTCLHED